MAEVTVSRPETSTLSAEGRVVVPASIRKALGLEPGVRLTFRLDGKRVILSTRDAAIAELQRMFAEVKTESGMLLSEELIAERHAEAARENAGIS